jgi:hypothetical protein
MSEKQKIETLGRLLNVEEQAPVEEKIEAQVEA